LVRDEDEEEEEAEEIEEAEEVELTEVSGRGEEGSTSLTPSADALRCQWVSKNLTMDSRKTGRLPSTHTRPTFSSRERIFEKVEKSVFSLSQ
jgi:hypothetical protein